VTPAIDERRNTFQSRSHQTEDIMHMHHSPPPRREPIDPNAPPEPVPTPLKWTLPVLLGLVAVLLLFEHRMHLSLILPWLLLGGCALMHLFMHRGHGAHKHGGHADAPRRGNDNREQTK
jgi:hypothetical protein